MDATATESEVEKFKLEIGDVLATKDSETPDDTANSALVRYEREDLLCGYHLTQIKPNRDELLGEYLFRLLGEHKFRGQFEVGANGVTRFALGIDEFASAYIPLPPVSEQTAIANYIDRKTAEIDKLIANKQKLIELLKEERTAIINKAVTKGINPDAKLKPSGIDWLGDIPEHWKLVPLTKYIGRIVDYRGKTPTKSEEGIFLVTARNIKNGEIDYSLSAEFILAEEYSKTMSRGELKIGDVLFTTEAPLGEAANVDRTDVAVAQRVIKFRGLEGVLDNYFLKNWINSNTFQQDLYTYSTGSAAIGIKASKLFHLRLLLPPIEEQAEIVQFITNQKLHYAKTISKIETEIELIREYRTALISEVVTGKVKVS